MTIKINPPPLFREFSQTFGAKAILGDGPVAFDTVDDLTQRVEEFLFCIGPKDWLSIRPFVDQMNDRNFSDADLKAFWNSLPSHISLEGHLVRRFLKALGQYLHMRPNRLGYW